jgi:hypothetical protein
VAERWNDLYQHDTVWERGEEHYRNTDPSGIDGTGVHARLGTVYDGQMGLKVAGLVGRLAGESPPSGTPIHDPICNTWVQSVDWSELRWGTLLLAFHDLPAGEYALHSYHNNFTCYRVGDSNVSCDGTSVQLLNMPSITAMALADAEGLIVDTLEPTFDPNDDTSTGYEGYKHYMYQDLIHVVRSGIDLGCGAGVQMLEADYDVPIQQVTSDSLLNTSLVKFRTDGSPVLIVYENGCCIADTVRPGRGGNRSILNAFRLDFIRPVEPGPIEPCPDAGAELDTPLRWWRSTEASSYDVYFGRAYGNVELAVKDSPEYLGNVADGTEGVDLEGYLELNTTYHWRRDKVTALGDVSRGEVWTFKTTPCHVVEDFASAWRDYDPWAFWMGYNAAVGQVWYSCRCGDEVYLPGAAGTGCGLEFHGCVLMGTADLDKALYMEYFNIVMKYSEAGHIMCPSDWLGVKATAVSLWFRGEAGNANDRLYLRVEDKDGSSAEVEYDGPAGLDTTQWQRWAVQLDELSGVDLSRVKWLYVGVGDRNAGASGATGRIYLDDVRLCRPHCLPDAARPAKDHNSDCVVNFPDHAMDSAVTGGNMLQYRDFAAVWLENTLWP